MSSPRPLPAEKIRFRHLLARAASRSTKELLKHLGSRQPAHYRSPAWLFARCLKNHEGIAHLDAEAATARIDAELADMFPESPNPWLDLGLQDFDSTNQLSDPRTDFISAWATVESPYLLDSFVKEAARLAEEKPLDLVARFSHAGDALLRRVASLCYWLGQRSPPKSSSGPAGMPEMFWASALRPPISSCVTQKSWASSSQPRPIARKTGPAGMPGDGDSSRQAPNRRKCEVQPHTFPCRQTQ